MRPKFTVPDESRKVIKTFEEAVAGFSQRSQQAVQMAVMELVAEVRRSIEEQTLKVPPLTPRYKAEKTRKGMDPRTLVATREYLDSIKYIQTLGGARIECDEERKRLLEGGTSKMPARPHWGPAMARLARGELGIKGKAARYVLFGR